MKFGILIVALMLGACSWLAHPPQPEVALTGLRMGPGDGLHQTVLVDLTITNVDASPLMLNALSYRVFVEGRELAAGTNREPLEIDAGASAKYTVPASINLMSGFGFIRDLLTKPKSRISYQVEATLEPVGLFSTPVTVRKTDTIDISK